MNIRELSQIKEKNVEQAIEGIICLGEREDENDVR